MAAEARSEGLPARAQRFAARLRGESLPTFSDWANPPNWSVAEQERHSELVTIVGLLHARPAIDAELNGGKLAALATFVGEDLFDAVCDADISQLRAEFLTDDLPTPVELVEQGEALVEKAQRHREFAPLAEQAAEILAHAQSPEMEPAE